MGSVKLKSRDYVSKPLGDGAQRKKAKVEAKLTQNTKKKKKKIGLKPRRERRRAGPPTNSPKHVFCKEKHRLGMLQ